MELNKIPPQSPNTNASAVVDTNATTTHICKFASLLTRILGGYTQAADCLLQECHIGSLHDLEHVPPLQVHPLDARQSRRQVPASQPRKWSRSQDHLKRVPPEGEQSAQYRSLYRKSPTDGAKHQKCSLQDEPRVQVLYCEYFLHVSPMRYVVSGLSCKMIASSGIQFASQNSADPMILQ